MDINNNLLLINTFVKGMNTDVSDALIDSSQYRYAENVRLATDKDENTGELRLIEGTSLYSSVISNYYGNIIAMTSIRDLLVVITLCKDETLDIYYNYILVRDTSITDSSDDYYGWIPVFTSRVDEEPVFSGLIKLVTRWENSNNIKLYMADPKNGLTYINLATYKTGKMLYGLSSIKANGNILLGPLTASLSSQSGSIHPAKVQYAYILYKEGGTSTQLSPMSNIVVVLKNNDSSGYDTLADISDKAVDLSVPNMDENDFTNMLIFRLSYRQIGSTPQVDMIYDGEFIWDYTDNGYNVKENMDYDEFLALTNDPIIPTVIESKGDYLFAANVKYQQDDADGMINEEINDNFDIQILSSGDYLNQDTSGTKLDYNELFSHIKQYDSKYWRRPSNNQEIGGDGTYLSWKLNVKYFIATRSSNLDSLVSQTHWIKKTCTSGNRPGETIDEQICSLRQGEVYRYGAIFYTATGKRSSVKWLCDIMAPVLPCLNYEGVTTLSGNTASDSTYKIPYIGIDFIINQMPEGFVALEIVRSNRTLNDKVSLMLGILGFPYEIDKRNIGQEGNAGWSGTTALCAPYIISTNRFKFDPTQANSHHNTSKADSTNNFALIACPEYVYLADDVKNLLKSPSGILLTPIRTLYKDAQHDGRRELGGVDLLIAEDEFDEDDAYDCAMEIQDSYDAANFYQLTRYSNFWDVKQSNGSTTWCFNMGAVFRSTYASNTQPVGDNKGNESSNHTRYIYTHDTPNVCLYDLFYKTGDLRNSNSVNIDLIAFVVPPDTKEDGNNFFNGSGQNKKKNYENSITNCVKAYHNWSIPFHYGASNEELIGDGNGGFYKAYDGDGSHSKASDLVCVRALYPDWAPTGTTGKYILAKFENSTIPFSETSDRIEAVITNIQRRSPNPYGGKDAIGTSSYVSHGNYYRGTSTSTVFDENDNASESIGTISVFDGDCYPGVFSFNVVHAWYDPELIVLAGNKEFFHAVRCASVCYAPIESDIDLFATTGDLYERLTPQKKFYFQDYPANFDGFMQTNMAYMYNTAYSYSDGISYTSDSVSYSSVTRAPIRDNAYDTRVYCSGLKNNGETLDNWLHFKPLNYLDVDSRFGQITNMRLFKDKLLFWLEHATGILSVNERTVLNDLDSNDIIVGTGDALSRFDYISTVYGMKPYQYDAETQSNTTQYWWDGYNKEILVYGGGMELIPLTRTKGLTNYINTKKESVYPSLSYDTKYDEVLSQVVTDGNKEETLVYSERIQAFSAVYTFNPWYKAMIGNILYITSNDRNNIYIHNDYAEEGFSLLFGQPAFPKVTFTINKNNIHTKTFDNITFGGRMYKGSLLTIENWPMERVDGEYIRGEHLNSPMHHLTFTFKTPLKQEASIRGNKAISVDEYDYRLAIPRSGQSDQYIEYGNRMRGKTMQCEIASDYNSTDFSLQYVTTKFRMSWS